MIKQFSTSHYLNPDGWKGENWDNLGYDIYSYFPKPGLYNGTFEVDYQNTWNDFWKITYVLKRIFVVLRTERPKLLTGRLGTTNTPR